MIWFGKIKIIHKLTPKNMTHLILTENNLPKGVAMKQVWVFNSIKYGMTRVWLINTDSNILVALKNLWNSDLSEGNSDQEIDLVEDMVNLINKGAHKFAPRAFLKYVSKNIHRDVDEIKEAVILSSTF